jgi:hypothetical protein
VTELGLSFTWRDAAEFADQLRVIASAISG